ncbi:MAG: PQQ-dependent sugar dehydrogenase, partial [Burkholderiaceae bacterium]
MNIATFRVKAIAFQALAASVFIAICGKAVAAPTVVTVADGLVHPWAVAFLPEGRFLVTERPGRMRVVQADGRLGAPLAGLPPLAVGGQGGLLDVVTDADFARNRRIYFCYSEPDADGGPANGTALASATLAPDAARLENLRVIFSQRPKVASTLHFGCRIVQAPDGALFLTLGERFHRKDDAQALAISLANMRRYQAEFMLRRSTDSRTAFLAEMENFKSIVDKVIAADIMKSSVYNAVKFYGDAFLSWVGEAQTVSLNLQLIQHDAQELVPLADKILQAAAGRKKAASTMLTASQTRTR